MTDRVPFPIRRSRRGRGGGVLLLAALALGGAFPSHADSGEGGQGEAFVRCTKCKNRGALPCTEHRTADCELEDNVLYCSRMGECAVCGGTGWVDCPHCVNEAVEKRLAKKRAGIPARHAAAAEINREMAKPVHLVESAHFVIVCELGPQKVGKKRLNAHEMIHLFADRLEQLFTDYTTILGVDEREFAKKCRIMIWTLLPDHARASLRFCSGTGPTGMKLLGVDPTYSVPGTKRFFKDDESLHRNVIHNTVHLLMSHQKPSLWIGNLKGGWADAGLAHWFEDRYWGKCDNYCYEEVDTTGGIKGGKWKLAVRKMVAAGTAPGLGGLMRQNTTTLTREQHAVAFSLIDYLMGVDPRKVNGVLKRLRAKASARDALDAEFGLSILRLEERWKQWVLDTYPRR